MGMAIVDGAMVTAFMEDGEAFDRAADELFASLDANGDGVLSRSELLKGFDGLLSPTAEAAVFEKFDGDGSGSVDREEFRAEMREIMTAVAQGIGDSPVQMALDDASFLTRVVEHERSKTGSGP